MDWQDKLQQFLDSNPELPQGVETELPAEQKKPALPLLRIDIDRKRAGKVATIVSGFEDESTARQVVAMLKSRLATGGSA
ncbi:MAG: hypothetical protein K2M76_07940, partial [Muribaculaceae bacterium]|nr:hypothetical protein [Muribaculaceae bacterium]